MEQHFQNWNCDWTLLQRRSCSMTHRRVMSHLDQNFRCHKNHSLPRSPTYKPHSGPLKHLSFAFQRNLSCSRIWIGHYASWFVQRTIKRLVCLHLLQSVLSDRRSKDHVQRSAIWMVQLVHMISVKVYPEIRHMSLFWRYSRACSDSHSVCQYHPSYQGWSVVTLILHLANRTQILQYYWYDMGIRTEEVSSFCPSS